MATHTFIATLFNIEMFKDYKFIDINNPHLTIKLLIINMVASKNTLLTDFNIKHTKPAKVIVDNTEIINIAKAVNNNFVKLIDHILISTRLQSMDKSSFKQTNYTLLLHQLLPFKLFIKTSKKPRWFLYAFLSIIGHSFH
jgi:hypothetical protein